jgi:hypothetical protein
VSRGPRGPFVAAPLLAARQFSCRGGRVTLALPFAAMLLTCSVMAGVQAKPASAEVLTNDWQQFVTFPVNTCNGEFVPVLTGVAHVVQRLQPDGSLITATNGHFVAVGTLDNEYQLNWQERFVSEPGQLSFTSRQLIVSTGSAPNHLVTFTFEFPPGTFTATERCSG